jgi:hypothetical protein
MFIALPFSKYALQRSAICITRFIYIPFLTERIAQQCRGYKHRAPPEQALFEKDA